MKAKQPQPSDKPIILLDTNVLGDLLNKKLEEQISSTIEKIQEDCEIATSQITYYEIVKKGKRDIGKSIKLIDSFKVFDINKEVLGIAGFMYCLGIKDC